MNNMYSKYIKNPQFHLDEMDQIRDAFGSEEWCEKVLDLVQDNFDGIISTNEILDLLKMEATDEVLDIGSGFGGVSLAIAMRMKDLKKIQTKRRAHGHVTGVEIQKDRCVFARSLAKDLHVDSYVRFKCDYFPDTRQIKEQYTKIVSVLAILHFLEKEKTLERIGHLLAPGGKLVIDDYYTTSKILSPEDRAALSSTISIPNLLTRDEYIALLEKSGVVIEDVIDLTDKWKELCRQRVEILENDRTNLVEKWGEKKTNNHIEFCRGVSNLYQTGIIHGFRIVGTKDKQ